MLEEYLLASSQTHTLSSSCSSTQTYTNVWDAVLNGTVYGGYNSTCCNIGVNSFVNLV